MYLTCRIVLKTDENSSRILSIMANFYRNEVNRLINLYAKSNQIVRTSYSEFSSFIPFWSKSMVVKDAERIWTLIQQGGNARLRMNTPQCCWHQPNFKFRDHQLYLQVGGRFGIGDYLIISYHAGELQQRYLKFPLGKMTIRKLNKRWIADINVEVMEKTPSRSEKRMGVDLGIKVPAVAYTEDGKIRFFGNGREARFRRNAFYSKLKKLQKSNDLKAYRALDHALFRWSYTVCHIISKRIVEFAEKNDIGVICVEQLHGISSKPVSSSLARRDLNQWSHYRLVYNIRYKARRKGIRVVFVDPRNTSRRCPRCGRINTPSRRWYCCPCGFQRHRDLIGAMNITFAPESASSRSG